MRDVQINRPTCAGCDCVAACQKDPDLCPYLPEAVVLACDGACEEHRGVVKTVHVGNGVFDWGNYNYCDAAAAVDCS